MPLHTLSPSSGRRLGAVLATGAVALPLAACGGAGGASSGSGAQAADEQDAARVRLSQCLRKHGLEVPDSARGGVVIRLGAGDEGKVREAEHACRKFRKAAFGDAPPTRSANHDEAFRRFASCMRRHGVDLPDPQPAGQGPPPAGGFDPNDPDVKAAENACRKVLPKGAGSPEPAGPE